MNNRTRHVEENPGLSVSRRSLESDILQMTLLRILHKDLGFKANKVQLTQVLMPSDYQQRRVFVDWVLEMHQTNPEFHRKIYLSGEAHFHIGSYVN